jgi:3-hydroxyisobutyrate dehydrogenase-like beta-hydroxyacid dehydrogenase
VLTEQELEERMKETIGVIGIGLVGTALAENLLKSGFDIVGFDIAEEKRVHLEQLGGKAAVSSKDVARQTNRFILSLWNTEVVKDVIEGPDGLLQSEIKPKYIIDTTTGDPEQTEALAQRLLDQNIHFLDATISGSSQQIRKREGAFMVGGNRAAFDACCDIFKMLAEKYFYVGPSGSGSKAKLASNVILGLNRLVLAEGLVFAEKLGLDLKTFLPLLQATPAYSCAMDVKGQKMVDNNFAPQSKITQHNKDLDIILEYAQKTEQELPLTRLHKKILEDVIAAGEGELDTSAVIKQIRRLGLA